MTAGGRSASARVDVHVLSVNDAPVFQSAAPLTATEDLPYNYAATVSDEDGPGRTWSLLPAHTCGGTLNPTSGAFFFTPPGPVPAASCILAIQV